jgi:hypothetical protein
MVELNQQAKEIRQFLLGQIQEKRAEQIEERAFTDPDFAEEVEIVESELIADYRAENLSPEDHLLFEQKYLKSAAGLRAVEYESAFHEFVQAKLRKDVPLQEGLPGQAATITAAAAPEEPGSEGWLSHLKYLFARRPAFAGLTVAVGLLLLAAGLWSLSLWSQSRLAEDDPAWAERRARETELARLNADGAGAANIQEGLAVNLNPMKRGGDGTITRLATGDLNRHELIELHLDLTQAGDGRYRAVFLDDRRNELFTVPDLAAQNTPDGPQVRLLVPAGYFKPGDYQIGLSALNKNGGYEEITSYALRVTGTR